MGQAAIAIVGTDCRHDVVVPADPQTDSLLTVSPVPQDLLNLGHSAPGLPNGLPVTCGPVSPDSGAVTLAIEATPVAADHDHQQSVESSAESDDDLVVVWHGKRKGHQKHHQTDVEPHSKRRTLIWYNDRPDSPASSSSSRESSSAWSSGSDAELARQRLVLALSEAQVAITGLVAALSEQEQFSPIVEEFEDQEDSDEQDQQPDDREDAPQEHNDQVQYDFLPVSVSPKDPRLAIPKYRQHVSSLPAHSLSE